MISFLHFLYALGIFKSNFNHIILKNFPPTREIKIVGILMPGYQVPPNDYKDLSKEIGNLLDILLKKNSEVKSENLNETSELIVETREAS